MAGVVLALLGAALATGVAELLLPPTETGTAKLFRFLVSLVILLLILTPFVGFLQKNEELLSGDIPFKKEESADFEQIFSNTVHAQSKADLERGLYELLGREYGISPKNATLLLRFDAQGALAHVSVYLSGAALTQNPDTLERALSQKLGCTVEVR
jgi:hypothetical protein